MKKSVFTGMATALVTPMTPDGIDYDSFGRFIDFQIESDDKVWPMIAPGGGNDEVFSEEDLEKK